MGCNCKNDDNGVKIEKTSNGKKEPIIIRATNLVVKVILFLMVMPVAGVIVPLFSIYLLFKVMFLNNEIDFSKNLKYFGKIILGKNKEDEEDEEDEYQFDEEDEFVLLDSE